MGDIEAARVDAGALFDVARRCDELAEVVDGVARSQLARLRFEGAVAGQRYVARGESLRHTVNGVVDQLPVWARALREIASALRASADRYVDVDARGAVRLG